MARRELTRAATELTIIAKPEQVSMTDNDGVTQRYQSDGRTHKVDIAAAKVDAETPWNKDILTQDFKSGDMKLTRTWQVSDDGSQLIVKVTTEGSGGGAPPLKFVYDRQ
ncbi:MAG: hypothetical protein ABI652_07325 [Acidobacteriota bacterium]